MAIGSNFVVIRGEALAAILRSPSGPVAKDLIKRGERIRVRARELVGVYQPQGPIPRARKPGQLRDSIVKRFVESGASFTVVVGTNDRIALWHHEGTIAHVIRPRRARHLVFFWPRVGRVVYLQSVNHPGTQPNRFLVNALPAGR